MVDAIQAQPGELVLDVATGTGLVARTLVRRYGCRVVGVDQSEQMLDRARELCAAYPRIELRRAEAERLPFDDGEFDALTVTYLLRYVDDPAATLRELARVVRPGGRIAMLDFYVPSGPVLRPAWWVYTRMGLPALGRIVSREWFDVGRFLGPNIDGFWSRHPLPAVLGMWRAAGIGAVEARKMSVGGGVVIWGVRDRGRA